MEILFPMMFGLCADIFTDGINMDGANTELSVACLPCEVGVPFVLLFDPSRRRGFHLFNNMCRRVIFGLREEYVHVIGD